MAEGSRGGTGNPGVPIGAAPVAVIGVYFLQGGLGDDAPITGDDAPPAIGKSG